MNNNTPTIQLPKSKTLEYSLTLPLPYLPSPVHNHVLCILHPQWLWSLLFLCSPCHCLNLSSRHCFWDNWHLRCHPPPLVLYLQPPHSLHTAATELFLKCQLGRVPYWKCIFPPGHIRWWQAFPWSTRCHMIQPSSNFHDFMSHPTPADLCAKHSKLDASLNWSDCLKPVCLCICSLCQEFLAPPNSLD